MWWQSAAFGSLPPVALGPRGGIYSDHRLAPADHGSGMGSGLASETYIANRPPLPPECVLTIGDRIT